MKWMGWGPDDLDAASVDQVRTAIRMINEEAERVTNL